MAETSDNVKFSLNSSLVAINIAVNECLHDDNVFGGLVLYNPDLTLAALSEEHQGLEIVESLVVIVFCLFKHLRFMLC